jgi:LmbE family N-acetylglucosaminyl deacetylase
LHQDHRLISELTWNTFRKQIILEYEIPKYDGDLGSPNFYIPLQESICRQKVALLKDIFTTQGAKNWFADDLFYSLMRLRGMEARSPSKYAEAFYAHKVIVSLGEEE